MPANGDETRKKMSNQWPPRYPVPLHPFPGLLDPPPPFPLVPMGVRPPILPNPGHGFVRAPPFHQPFYLLDHGSNFPRLPPPIGNYHTRHPHSNTGGRYFKPEQYGPSKRKFPGRGGVIKKSRHSFEQPGYNENLYTASIFQNPWKDLITEDEEKAHHDRIANRFCSDDAVVLVNKSEEEKHDHVSDTKCENTSGDIVASDQEDKSVNPLKEIDEELRKTDEKCRTVTDDEIPSEKQETMITVQHHKHRDSSPNVEQPAIDDKMEPD